MNINKPMILRHYSTISPEKMANSELSPKYNCDMYKKEYSKVVFATSLKSASKAYFFLHCSHFYMYSDNDKVIVILKSFDDLKNSFNHIAYLYEVSSDSFTTVLDNEGNPSCEWVSSSPISIKFAKVYRVCFDDIITDNFIGNKLTIFYANDYFDYNKIRKNIDKINDFDQKYKFLINNSELYEGKNEIRKLNCK